MSAPFNKLAARKELGAILHRLDEPNLHTNILRHIVRRHIENLIETLPVEDFGATLLALRDALILEAWSEIRKIVKEVQGRVPTTIAMIPAGTVVELPDGRVVIKRKGGVESTSTGFGYDHLAADCVVTVVNI